MKLRISTDISLPIDAITQTFAILAVRGVGKTHTASVMAEEMLKQRQPICVYDPTGAWWGLKASADAKSPGYPVYVFGGEHADVPLEESAGDTIATAIVEQRIPSILDVSLLRKGARTRFMTDFLETLYHKNREPLHLFIDEAHTLAPQKPQPDVARCLGAIEDIILQGRRRGLGMTSISQRPALLNTNIRSLCEVLIAMRIIGPHDRKAVMEWIEAHGTPEQAKELLASLPHLGIGEGWVWSPAWLNLFKRTKFRARETFDSSATPKAGSKPVTPKELAAIDVAKLGDAIRKTVEDKKANDPAALRQKLATAEKALQAAQQVKSTAKPEIVEKPVVTDKQVKDVEQIIGRVEREGQRRIEAAEKLAESGRELVATAKEFAVALGRAQSPILTPVQRALPQRPLPAVRPRPERQSTGDTSDLPGPERKILNALAWLESIGVAQPENSAVAFLAGYTVGGGGYNNPRGSLRTKGLIEYAGGDCLSLTDTGREVAQAPEGTLTNADMHAKVLSVLPGPEQRILGPLLKCYPDPMTNEDLAEAAGYTVGAGGYNNPRGRLRTLGLIEYTRDGVKARSILFPESVAA